MFININKNKNSIFDMKSSFDNYVFLVLNIHRFIESFIFILVISIYLKTFFLIKLIIIRIIFNFFKKYKSTLILYFAILTPFLMYLQTSSLIEHDNSDTKERSLEERIEEAAKLQELVEKLIIIFILGFFYGGFVFLVCHKLENAMLSKAMTEMKISSAKKEYLLYTKSWLRIFVFSGVFTAGMLCSLACISGILSIYTSFFGNL